MITLLEVITWSGSYYIIGFYKWLTMFTWTKTEKKMSTKTMGKVIHWCLHVSHQGWHHFVWLRVREVNSSRNWRWPHVCSQWPSVDPTRHSRHSGAACPGRWPAIGPSNRQGQFPASERRTREKRTRQAMDYQHLFEAGWSWSSISICKMIYWHVGKSI